MNKKVQPEMTRKEALAVLHKAHKAVGFHLFSPDASEEEKVLREQIYKAFSILDKALYGEALKYNELCNFCYLHMSMGNTLVATKNDYTTKPCCTKCFRQFKAGQKLLRIETWNGENWIEREVVQ